MSRKIDALVKNIPKRMHVVDLRPACVPRYCLKYTHQNFCMIIVILVYPTSLLFRLYIPVPVQKVWELKSI
jgi:hypothetical protein